MQDASKGRESRQGSRRYDWLSNAGDDGALTITSSRRLARELRDEYAERCYLAGKRAWNTPSILYWRDWCERTVVASGTSTLGFIDDATERLIWEQSLLSSSTDSEASAVGLAPLARSTWQRLHEWDVSLDEVKATAASKEERAFAQAASTYRQTLSEAGWLDRSALFEACITALRSMAEFVPTLVIVAGFDRRPPAVERVLDVLRSLGAEVRAHEAEKPARRICKESYADREAELRAAGRWARQRLEEDVSARIAIVVSDLHANAERYRRLVVEGFAPGWQLSGTDYRAALNVSLGRPLAAYPMVTVALLVLKAVSEGLTSSEASVLLRTPYLSSDGATMASRQDLHLRRFPDRRWSAAALSDLFSPKQTEPDGANAFERLFGRIASSAAYSGEQRSPTDWAAEIDELLCAVGWPGEHALTSAEYQVRNRWRELLNEFSAIQPVLPSCTLCSAIGRLTRAAQEAVYQPESGGEPLQLMGVLEAAGFEFDHLWVAGMEAARWPPVNKPLSLVSRALQRRHEMPDASPDDTLEYGRRVVHRLSRSAADVRMTWAAHASDHLQAPSPLLRELATATEAFEGDPGWHAASAIGTARIVALADDSAPAVAGSERLHGGSRSVNLQLEEPFAAFAAGRLAAVEVQAFEGGLPPRLRGTLLHAAAQELMAELPTRDEMGAWGDDEIAVRVERATRQAYALHFARADAVLRRLLAIEQSRSREILADFVKAEQQRAPFSIQGVESRLQFECHGMLLEMRADRVDARDDGAVVVVDYKSGAATGVLKSDGTPNDYQLVLYAMAQSAPVSGLLLTYLVRPEIDYRGVGVGNGFSADEWTQAMERWTSEARAALAQIASGDVRLPAVTRGRAATWLDVLSRIEERRRGE